MKGNRSFIKKGLAVFMMFVMMFMLPATPLAETHVKAAEANRGVEYIKELRIFIHKGLGDARKSAEDWCAKQGEEWKVMGSKETGDLNRGSAGAGGISAASTFLCYCTTTDPKEAIRDLAVMNEKGNYSEGAYERILKDQKDQYQGMVKDMKTMLDEYRKNYQKNLPTAVTAHDYLNTYKEDDSGKLLGDLLLDITDDALAELLLQANGKVVIFIEQQLAAACDTGNSTFLDRMTKINGYGNLRSKFLLAYNNDVHKAEQALKANYAEKAAVIYDCWNDVHDHIDDVKKNMVKYGVLGMTKEQYKQWLVDNVKDSSIFVLKQEFDILTALSNYKYGDGTLLDFFLRTQDSFQGENIKDLYPVVACLSKGQFSAINECVSMFSIVADSLGAALKNNYKTGESSKILENITSEEKQVIEDSKKVLDDTLTKISSQEKISVYEGVDREIFKGGIAVTSTAENYSHGSETKWADKFVESGDYKKYSIAMGGAAIGSFLLAGLFNFAQNKYLETGIYNLFHDIKNGVYGIKDPNYIEFTKETINKSTFDYVKQVSDYETALNHIKYGRSNDAVDAFYDIETRVLKESKAYYMFKYLKIGFTVLGILLSVADITLSIITLVKYYNRDHLPIPRRMVDLSYNENKETSYIIYKSVLDNNGNCGDLNGDAGKQWLALYATYDEEAGKPILAPSDDQKNVIIQYGSSKVDDTGYLPLHMFGTPNVPQNLTYADGENGFSFNDELNGIYLFFRRDAAIEKKLDDETVEEDNTKVEAEEDKTAPELQTSEIETVTGTAVDVSGTGTALGGGTIALIAFGCAVGGGFAGFVIATSRRRKIRKG